MIEQQSIYEAAQEFGAELEKLKLDLTDIDARYKASSKALAGLEEKRTGTKRYIKSAEARSGSSEGRIKFTGWQRKDQSSLIVILVFLLVAVAMGMANVYANLMSSGNSVFIESPWLAVMLSTLLPIASVSIKFITNFFEYDHSRRRYALCIYMLTLIALLIWSVLFALNFSGVSSGIDWNSFEQGSGTGAALVWSQLIVEMLAASALFLAAEDIYMRYSPDRYIENLEFIEVSKALKEHLAAHEALREQRGNMHGRMVELEAEHDGFINKKIVEYISIRARHIAAMNVHSNP